jgi:hypothetical protein
VIAAQARFIVYCSLGCTISKFELQDASRAMGRSRPEEHEKTHALEELARLVSAGTLILDTVGILERGSESRY